MRIRIGPSKITKYERARIVGARSLQLAMGAPILVAVPQTATDLIDIALLELEGGMLPMTIRRSLPDGVFQDIPLSWLMEKS